MSRFFLVLVLYWVSWSTAVQGETIMVALSDSGYAPLHMRPSKSGSIISEGIIVDVLNEFRKDHAAYKFDIRGLPRQRVNFGLDNGTIQLSFGNPIFMGKKAADYLWTEPFGLSKDVVVMRKDKSFPFRGPDDLIGKKIGKIRGYSYADYDKLFEAGVLKGVSVTESSQLINMLKVARLDCFFGNSVVTPYEIKQAGEDINHYMFSEKELYTFEYRFQISKHAFKLKEDLNGFLKKARQDGRLDETFRRYL